MKKNGKYNHRKKKGKKGAGLTIALSISGVIMTGLVLWLGVNDWNVDRSYERGLEVLGISTTVEEGNEKPEIHGEPDKLPVNGNEATSQEPAGTSEEKVDDSNTAGGETEVEPNKPLKQPVKPADKPDKDASKNTKVDAGGYIEGQTLPKEPTYVDGFLIANKKNPLPATFAPGENKKARAAFEKMAAEAKLSGFNMTAFSTYRSYDRQVELYERYVAKDGKEAADTYSARAGYSEHQTGLAFDIGEVNYEQHFASSSFGETDSGKWISANAHRFGFILRYPKGKEQVTGYMHEAWHFRYVGEKAAGEIYKNKSTLEEYLGIQ